MITFKKFQTIEEAIQFNNGAAYGQIVILAGGPASGKGFVRDWVLDVGNYKTRDVDDFKKKFLRLLHKRKTNLTEEEIKILSRLNEVDGSVKDFMKDSSNVAMIHHYVSKKINRQLDSLKIKERFHQEFSEFLENIHKENILADPKTAEDIKDKMENFIVKEFGKLSKSILENYFKEHFYNFLTTIKLKSVSSVDKLINELFDFFVELIKNEDFYPKDISYLQEVAAKNKENLPNLLFDITFNNSWYLETIIPKFIAAGYDSENIHLVWVISDLELAEERNKARERVVPSEIMLRIHAQVIENVLSVLSSKSFIPKALNGDVYIIDNKDIDIEELQDRMMNKKSISYNNKYFVLSRNDLIKIKLKSAGNPDIDLSKLKHIKDQLLRNINYLESEEHLHDHLNNSKDLLSKIRNESDFS